MVPSLISMRTTWKSGAIKQSVKSKNLCNQPGGKMVREDTNHGDIK